jgi:hypothetical protein
MQNLLPQHKGKGDASREFARSQWKGGPVQHRPVRRNAQRCSVWYIAPLCGHDKRTLPLCTGHARDPEETKKDIK